MFQTKTELENYVETSNSSLYYLLLKIFNVEDMNVDHAISHLAKAQGICNLLRSLSSANSIARALPPIPQDVLLSHGCSHERVIRHRDDDVGVQNCIFEVAGLANIHLEKSRKLADKVPSHVKVLFLPAIATSRYLERLRRVDFKLNDPKLRRRDTVLPVFYLWNKIRKTY